MRSEFATATRIIFGAGTVEEVPSLAIKMGQRACIVTGSSKQRAVKLIDKLESENLKCLIFNVSGEPTTTLIIDGINQAREFRCDLVIGIGGGSVIDTGKVIAALLTNRGKLEDYLEVIGLGGKISEVPVPYIAIPTTAGTGAEVTRNSVINSLEHRVKVSMRSPLMLPKLAVVDPNLCVSMPPDITASTGLDALTQLLEVFVCNQPNAITDGICREGLRLASQSLQQAYKNGNNLKAREKMSLASLLSGMALANAKLGAVHGFAGTLGGFLNAPHGAVCASLLPIVMDANIQALISRQSHSSYLKRYDEVAKIFTGNDQATAQHGIEWVRNLYADLQIPSLARFGLKKKNIPDIVAQAKKASSMKGNPIELTIEELTDILYAAGGF